MLMSAERSFKHNVGIRGIGAYVPERIVTNHDMAQIVTTSHEWIHTKLGINERRLVGKEDTVVSMAVKAAERAIESACIDKSDIDLVIASSVSFDYKVPTLAATVAAELNLEGVAAFDVNAGGCCGFVFSVLTGTKYIDNTTVKKVLCISSDVHSSILNWNDRTSCVIFGDGAGAAILDTLNVSRGLFGFDFGSSMSKALRLPTSQIPGDDMTFLSMQGKEVMNFAVNAIPKSVSAAVENVGIRVSDIDFFVCHQANINIIKQGLELLEVDYDKTHITIDRYGNTGGASVCITCEEAINEGMISDGDLVAMVAFGGGLTWGTLLFEWHSNDEFDPFLVHKE